MVVIDLSLDLTHPVLHISDFLLDGLCLIRYQFGILEDLI